MPLSIFLVEDHPLMRMMLTETIATMASLTVCGSAGSAEAALDTLSGVEPDLMLVDMSLPGMSGADLVRRLRAERPATPCVMLSGHGEAAYVRQAFEAGAEGYILKGDPYELERAIRRVAAGERYVSDALRSAL